MFICPFFVAVSVFSPLHEQLPHKADALNLATPQDTHPNEELKLKKKKSLFSETSLQFTFQKAASVEILRQPEARRILGVPAEDTPHREVDAPGLPM